MASTTRVANSGRTATATSSTAPAARARAMPGAEPAITPMALAPTEMQMAATGPGRGWEPSEYRVFRPTGAAISAACGRGRDRPARLRGGHGRDGPPG